MVYIQVAMLPFCATKRCAFRQTAKSVSCAISSAAAEFCSLPHHQGFNARPVEPEEILESQRVAIPRYPLEKIVHTQVNDKNAGTRQILSAKCNVGVCADGLVRAAVSAIPAFARVGDDRLPSRARVLSALANKGDRRRSLLTLGETCMRIVEASGLAAAAVMRPPEFFK